MGWAVGYIVGAPKIILYVISWDWGYLSIPISNPHPQSQSQLLDNEGPVGRPAKREVTDSLKNILINKLSYSKVAALYLSLETTPSWFLSQLGSLLSGQHTNISSNRLLGARYPLLMKIAAIYQTKWAFKLISYNKCALSVRKWKIRLMIEKYTHHFKSIILIFPLGC